MNNEIKTKMTFYTLASVAVTLFGILLAPILISDVEAFHCSTTNHCYANYKNTSFNTNYGVKADVTAANVYAPCGSTHHLTAVPIWMNFGGSPTEWLEIGYGTGWIATDTTCQNGDILYYYTKIDNQLISKPYNTSEMMRCESTQDNSQLFSQF